MRARIKREISLFERDYSHSDWDANKTEYTQGFTSVNTILVYIRDLRDWQVLERGAGNFHILSQIDINCINCSINK